MSNWLKTNTSLEFSFVEPCRPGWVLSKKVKGSSDVYFLESHGIILHSDSEMIINDWALLEKKFCEDFGYVKLYQWLDAATSFQPLFEMFAGKPMPYKCYFPDVAVFAERLEKVLQRQTSGEFLFPEGALRVDRDMAELWLATQLIYSLCPQFPEVPMEISSVIRDLPTEKLRREREMNHG